MPSPSCGAHRRALLAAFAFGPYTLSPPQAWPPCGPGRLPTTTPPRGLAAALPRVAAGLLVGMALSAAGAAYQGMFRNPLVSPDILGVSAGAGLGAALAIYFGLPLAAVQAIAFVGGLLAVAAVVFVAGRVRRHDPVLVLVLAGVAVGTLFSAGISLIKVLADPTVQLPAITFWCGRAQRCPRPATLGCRALVVAVWSPCCCCAGAKPAVAVGRGSRRAGRERGRACAAFDRLRHTDDGCRVSIPASSAGWPVVPHAARLLVGPEFSRLLPASLLLGGGFLVAADTLARSAAAIELPLGILTALVGAPVFLWLLARTGRGG